MGKKKSAEKGKITRFGVFLLIIVQNPEPSSVSVG